MDLITQVVNSRYPINTKCKVKIAMLEQKRLVLKRKIQQAMVTDFKVSSLSDKTIDRIKRSWLLEQPEKSLVTALLIHSLVGGYVIGGLKFKDGRPLDHYTNMIDGDAIDIVKEPEEEITMLNPMDTEGLASEPSIQPIYESFVNRYMKNFMEEIK